MSHFTREDAFLNVQSSMKDQNSSLGMTLKKEINTLDGDDIETQMECRKCTF